MHVGTLNFLVRRLPGDERPLEQLYQAAVDRVVRTERLGFDFALSGEHHFMPTQWNPSPLMVLAAIAARTTRIRLGTNVLLTPLYDPVRLSEDIATLDLLSNGRLDAAFGAGSIRFEFETYRVAPAERVGRMWEVMDIVARSFAEDEFDYEGKYFQIPHLRQTTKPVQDPFPMWYGGLGPKNLERAGREGYHLQLGGGGKVERYLAGLEAGGRAVDEVNIGAWAPQVHVVATKAEIPAEREIARAMAAAIAAEYSPEGRDLAFERLEKGMPAAPPPDAFPPPIVGTPGQVLEALAPLYEASPFSHVLFNVLDHQMDLFAGEILPTLRGWGREPVTAAKAR